MNNVIKLPKSPLFQTFRLVLLLSLLTTIALMAYPLYDYHYGERKQTIETNSYESLISSTYAQKVMEAILYVKCSPSLYGNHIEFTSASCLKGKNLVILNFDNEFGESFSIGYDLSNPLKKNDIFDKNTAIYLYKECQQYLANERAQNNFLNSDSQSLTQTYKDEELKTLVEEVYK